MKKSLLALLSLAGIAVAQEDAPVHRARFATVFTFLDAVFDSDREWHRGDVEETLKMAKSLGVERLYWRVDAGGTMVYPSKVAGAYQWDGRGEKSSKLVTSIRNLGDPLQVFAEVAKAQGIEFYAWYPIRDRNSTSNSYNPHHPGEAEAYAATGRYAVLSPFYGANPQWNMERKQGDGSGVTIPTVTALKLTTSDRSQVFDSERFVIWESEDNLRYRRVADSWEVTREEGENETLVYRVSGLEISQPWIKIAQREHGKGDFHGGVVDDWISVQDGTGHEWHPYPWLVSSDTLPEFGEGRYPYKSASRAADVRHDVPWDTITKLRFDSSGGSIALYTPAMQPERYLLGYPCFAYPEVRQHELAVIRELLERPIDGIALCLRTHVRSNRGEDYGFNPPVREAYRKRYGVEVDSPEFDPEKFAILQGEIYTGLLREISAVVRENGRKLVAMYEPEPELGLEWQAGQMSPWWDLGKVRWPWQQWAKEGMVDQLLVFTTGFNLPWDERLHRYLKEVRQQASGTEISLFYDPDYAPHRQDPKAYQAMVRSAMAADELDEVNVFEYVEFWNPQQPLHQATRELQLGVQTSINQTK